VTPSRTKLIAGAGVAAALAASAPAGAQDANQDPSPASPGGTVYEIPLDQARGDAAPRSTGGGDEGGGTTPASGEAAQPGTSSIRSSDNGSGSTGVVPGAPSGGAGGERPAERERERGRDGKARSAPGERDVAPSSPQAVVVAAGAGSPSIVRSSLLIALGVAIAAALGIAAHRRRA
jgi:hypothetical protein